MMEILNINDNASTNFILENISQIHYDKVRNGRLRETFSNFDREESESIYSEKEREFVQAFIDCVKLKKDCGIAKRGIQD